MENDLTLESMASMGLRFQYSDCPAKILMEFENLLSECESPIEAKFLTALFDHCAFDDAVFIAKHQHPFITTRDNRLRVGCQVKFDKYRVDFMMVKFHPNGTGTFLIIECDGHEFHERTKEQARRDRSRDRMMTAAGARVLRFTGSEIHQNPDSCVGEVATIIECDSIDDWRLTNG